jgi:hypothetical protein
MLALIDAHLDRAATALDKSPHALAEWVKMATKARRDAAGIARPEKHVATAGDSEHPVNVDMEVRDVIAQLPSEMGLQLRDIVLESIRIRAMNRARAKHALPMDALAARAPSADSGNPSTEDRG